MPRKKDLQELIDRTQRLRDTIECPPKGIRQEKIWEGRELEIHLLAFADKAEYEGTFVGETVYFVLNGHVRFRLPRGTNHMRSGELITIPRGILVHSVAHQPSKVMAVVTKRG